MNPIIHELNPQPYANASYVCAMIVCGKSGSMPFKLTRNKLNEKCDSGATPFSDVL